MDEREILEVLRSLNYEIAFRMRRGLGQHSIELSKVDSEEQALVLRSAIQIVRDRTLAG